VAAFNLLKPKRVLEAEKLGVEVQRQGEFFFARTDYTDETLRQLIGAKTKAEFETLTKARPLERRRAKTPRVNPLRDRIDPSELSRQSMGASNQHHCRWVAHKGKVYATGRVIHRDPDTGNATGEHKSLKLEGWYEVSENTELFSLSGSAADLD
jgi:hypothetical protein